MLELCSYPAPGLFLMLFSLPCPFFLSSPMLVDTHNLGGLARQLCLCSDGVKMLTGIYRWRVKRSTPACYAPDWLLSFCCFAFYLYLWARTRTRTNTNPNGTEANAAGRSGNARALRKQSKCGMIQEGEGHWPNSSKNLQLPVSLLIPAPQGLCLKISRPELLWMRQKV